jgi:hypothetical protein
VEFAERDQLAALFLSKGDELVEVDETDIEYLPWRSAEFIF